MRFYFVSCVPGDISILVVAVTNGRRALQYVSPKNHTDEEKKKSILITDKQTTGGTSVSQV